MPEERLAIPLYENPTRQKAWRVVWFLTPIVLMTILGFALYRGFLTRDTLSEIAPEGTTTIIRIIKTPKSVRILSERFGDAAILENSPWTTENILSWANREVALFMDGTEIIGIGIDKTLAEDVQNTADELGLPVFSSDHRGLPRVNLALLSPFFHGEIIAPKGDVTSAIPLRLTENAIVIPHGMRPGVNAVAINVPKDASSLALLSLEGRELEDISSLDVPLVFPGIRAYLNEAREKGATVYFGEDSKGFTFTLSIPGGNLSQEDMESLVSELFYAPLIKAVVFEDENFTFDEFRPENMVAIETQQGEGVTIVSARDQSGSLMRATKTVHTLIVSNRDVSLETTNPSTEECLARTREFVKPNALRMLIPGVQTTQGSSFIEKLLSAKEIAFSKKTTKICW